MDRARGPCGPSFVAHNGLNSTWHSRFKKSFLGKVTLSIITVMSCWDTVNDNSSINMESSLLNKTAQTPPGQTIIIFSKHYLLNPGPP